MAAPSAPAESAATFPTWIETALLAVLRATPEAIADVRSNTAPPAPKAVGGLAEAFSGLATNLPACIAKVRANQGYVAALARLLEAADQADAPDAALLREGILQVFSALDEIEADVARVQSFLNAFAPAPNASGGMGQRIGRG